MQFTQECMAISDIYMLCGLGEFCDMRCAHPCMTILLQNVVEEPQKKLKSPTHLCDGTVHSVRVEAGACAE